MSTLRAIGAVLLASLAALPLCAAEMARVRGADALTLPGPELDRPLTPRAGRRAIVSPLLERAGAGRGLASVVVLLDAEELRDGGARDDHDLARIGWLASEFARDAREAGFVPGRALSHFPVVAGEIDTSRLARLAAIRWVAAVAPDIPLVPARVEGGALVSAPRFRVETGLDGRGVGVAVVDTGIDASHPELAGRVVFARDYTGSGTVGNTDGHGTAVAGIVAGSGGIAPGASLWSVKVLPGTSSTVLAGLNDLWANRSASGGLHILNLSFEAPSVVSNGSCDDLDPASAKLMNAFDGAGIVVVAASGNQARHDGVSYPACLSKVVAVGAVYDAELGGPRTYPNADCTDETASPDTSPCYSNSGDLLDLLAPSDCARTPGRGNAYEACFNGTSAAAPYAAGVAALLRSGRPTASAADIRNALASTGRPIATPAGVTRNRINALAAWSALAGSACLPDLAPMACGSTVTGFVDASGCRADGSSSTFRTIAVTAGDTLAPACTSPSFTPAIALYRPDFTEAARNSAGGSLTYLAEVSGEWRIEISRPAGAAGGDYGLTVDCGTPPLLPRRRAARR